VKQRERRIARARELERAVELGERRIADWCTVCGFYCVAGERTREQLLDVVRWVRCSWCRARVGDERQLELPLSAPAEGRLDVAGADSE
jgi:hypothetical protein